MEDVKEAPLRKIIFVLGAPGSGKGTLCKIVTELTHQPRYEFVHLSVGDHLRELCDPKATSPGAELVDRNKIQNYMRENILLPAATLIPVLKRKIESIPSRENVTTVWLIDGFPRDMETARAFEAKIGKPAKVIVLECSPDIARSRFLGRAREETDDEKRFEKRYAEYINNMKAIRVHYATIMEIVCVSFRYFTLLNIPFLFTHSTFQICIGGKTDECQNAFLAAVYAGAGELESKKD
ncbi:P-loop containing nucleoside triphosphate hydrolase protein [Xylaria nigripes]|nr:P-loop containing nucleoside triphosphate hydrolase protein [Xylaria nigripes]